MLPRMRAWAMALGLVVGAVADCAAGGGFWLGEGRLSVCRQVLPEPVLPVRLDARAGVGRPPTHRRQPPTGTGWPWT